jgi:hypothetical protein
VTSSAYPSPDPSTSYRPRCRQIPEAIGKNITMARARTRSLPWQWSKQTGTGTAPSRSRGRPPEQKGSTLQPSASGWPRPASATAWRSSSSRNECGGVGAALTADFPYGRTAEST